MHGTPSHLEFSGRTETSLFTRSTKPDTLATSSPSLTYVPWPLEGLHTARSAVSSEDPDATIAAVIEPTTAPMLLSSQPEISRVRGDAVTGCHDEVRRLRHAAGLELRLPREAHALVRVVLDLSELQLQCSADAAAASNHRVTLNPAAPHSPW
jgi:hypothetical protein